MRKIFLTALLASAVLTGCSDAYDIDQAGVVTEESQVFRTPADIDKGIRYVYAMFPGESEIAFDSYFTDELGLGIGNAGQGINDGSYGFILLSGNGNAQSIWGSYYGVVNRLNRIKNRIEEMTVQLEKQKEGLDPLSEEAITIDNDIKALVSHKANVYALRAYCHYKLFAYFTPDYKNQNGLSVIKFDFLQTDNYKRYEKRATVAEIVTFIEDDISNARKLGGVVQSPGGQGTGYASNEMLDAILIKLYSMTQRPNDYVLLEEAFTRLAKTKSLANKSTYEFMFNAGAASANSEGIFKLNRVSTDGSVQSGVASAWYPARVGQAPYMEMGRSLYNELDKLDPSKQGTPFNTQRLDLRYKVAVYSNSEIDPNYASLSQEDYFANDIIYVGKYDGTAVSNRPLMSSLWMFRFTDMLLTLAEKRAAEDMFTGTVAIGDYSNVESIIFNIRANRNRTTLTPASMPTDFSSREAAYARILEERRVEFAFEGHRYLDMKRLGLLANSPGFVRDPQDCAANNACNLPANSLKLTMPIPRTEMVSNPNMVQNPGY